MFLVRKIVWKCFVWPGVRDTLTTCKPKNINRVVYNAAAKSFMICAYSLKTSSNWQLKLNLLKKNENNTGGNKAEVQNIISVQKQNICDFLP